MMKEYPGVHKLAWALVIIGALNWGLVGIFKWNLVNAIFGGVGWLERLIYILVGASGVLLLAGMSSKSHDHGSMAH